MMRRRWLLDAGIANAVDDLPQRLGLYISDIHNKYTFELLSTNSAAIGANDLRSHLIELTHARLSELNSYIVFEYLELI